jgi:transcriptional regulator with XRE-family HTH domain
MSYMGLALQRIAQENGRTQKEIAQAANVAPSQLNRLFSGSQTSVTNEDFAAIVAATARTNRERAEIIAARMRDCQVGPGAELIEIVIRGKEKKDERDPFNFGQAELPHEQEKALAFLRSQIPSNPALGELFVNHARSLGMK